MGKCEHNISCIHTMYNQSIYAHQDHLFKNLQAEQVAHVCSGPVGADMSLWAWVQPSSSLGELGLPERGAGNEGWGAT